ncbi:MAG: hypothetical protein LAT75_06525 [Candidatus Cyclonatronum sp.]|uniref:DUF6850 family outer membrane beta-barrel protein n=1 Tax=Cyclonatronum sp. TaxID=3024185 RepID=UPI0025C04B51|nr:DUF6850 family outer membrane beta-barrel protein [Cyclonatronum sp.]MCH8486502.1 hypothetical protein [Cyclonatronum sp.]
MRTLRFTRLFKIIPVKLVFLCCLPVFYNTAGAQVHLFEINPAVNGQFRAALPDTAAGIFREGGNPAGLSEAGLSETGLLSVGAFAETGTHRQVQQPSGLFYGSFFAEGTQKVNSWHVSGSVSLNRGISENQQFLSRAPVHNHNPYQWTDTTGGSWTNNLVSLRGVAGSPLLGGRFAAGLSAEYDVMQGARQNAERPLFQYSRYQLRAGLSYHLSDQTEAGLSLHFGESNQEKEIGFFNQLDTFVLLLRGIGTFSQTSFNSASRTYQAHQTGGGIQLLRRTSQMVYSYALSYTSSDEGAQTGISNPIPAGNWQQQLLQSRNAVRFQSSAVHHEFRFIGELLLGEGTDPLLGGINTELMRVSALLGWETINSLSGRKHGLSLHLLDYSMKDRVSLSEQLHTRLMLEAALTMPMFQNTLLVKYQPGVSLPLQNKLSFRSANSVISRIFEPDFDFLDHTVLAQKVSLNWLKDLGSYDLGVGMRFQYQLGLNAGSSFITQNRSFGALFLLIRY